MTDAFALMLGYAMGWLSVIIAHRILQIKCTVGVRAEPEKEKERIEREETPEEKKWREELSALWNYDANYKEKGGVMSGNQEESGGYL